MASSEEISRTALQKIVEEIVALLKKARDEYPQTESYGVTCSTGVSGIDTFLSVMETTQERLADPENSSVYLGVTPSAKDFDAVGIVLDEKSRLHVLLTQGNRMGLELYQRQDPS